MRLRKRMWIVTGADYDDYTIYGALATYDEALRVARLWAKKVGGCSIKEVPIGVACEVSTGTYVRENGEVE